MKTLLPVMLLVSLRLTYAAAPQMIGPFGGSAATVQVDPQRPGVVLAATSSAMIFRSSDYGESWTRLPFPAELHSTLHAFAIADHMGTYIAGVAGDDPATSGVFLSDDEGRSWEQALSGEDIWSIAIWRRDPRVIAAGAADGVFLTDDAGEHWRRISPALNPAPMPVVSLEFDPDNRMIIYAGTPHLPWRTTDGGQTWSRARAGMLDDSDVFSIHVDLSQHTRVFASACSGLYRSVNQGLSWTKLTGAPGASYRTYQITQDPKLLHVLFAGTTSGLIRSTDGGATWRKLSPHIVRSIAFDPGNDKRIYIATDDAGLLRSDDLGDTVEPINKGFCNRHILSLAALGGTVYAAASSASTSTDLFRNTDGQGWEKIASFSSREEQRAVKILPADPTHLYLLTTTTVLLSMDGGRSWMSLGPPSTEGLTALLAPKGDHGKLFVAGDSQIYYTTDAGKTWLEGRNVPRQFPVRSLVAVGPRGVAAATASSVFVAKDGVDYEKVTSPAADSEIHELIATDNADLFAATSLGLKRSDDFGATWQAVDGVLDGNTVTAICKHPTRPGVLFAARYGLIFISVDNGRTWQAVTSAAERLPSIRKLVVAPGIPNGLFAITTAQGVYFVPLKPEFGWTECRNRTCDLVRIQVP